MAPAVMARLGGDDGDHQHRKKAKKERKRNKKDKKKSKSKKKVKKAHADVSSDSASSGDDAAKPPADDDEWVEAATSVKIPFPQTSSESVSKQATSLSFLLYIGWASGVDGTR